METGFFKPLSRQMCAISRTLSRIRPLSAYGLPFHRRICSEEQRFPSKVACRISLSRKTQQEDCRNSRRDSEPVKSGYFLLQQKPRAENSRNQIQTVDRRADAGALHAHRFNQKNIRRDRKKAARASPEKSCLPDFHPERTKSGSLKVICCFSTVRFHTVRSGRKAAKRNISPCWLFISCTERKAGKAPLPDQSFRLRYSRGEQPWC